MILESIVVEYNQMVFRTYKWIGHRVTIEFVPPLNNAHDGGLARSGWTDNSGNLAWWKSQVQIVENLHLGACWICEIDILQGDVSVQRDVRCQRTIHRLREVYDSMEYGNGFGCLKCGRKRR